MRRARGVYKARGPKVQADHIHAQRIKHLHAPDSPAAPAMCVQMSSDLCVRRRRFIRVLKPLLARKRSSSARINLNRHWNELEEVYARPAAAPAVHFDTLLLHNELNDNAINEAREAAAAAAAAAATAAAATVAAAAKVLLPADSTQPADDDELLTPPATPCRPATASSTFNFGGSAMEDDAADWPLTPTTPLAWDVFTFPALTPQTPQIAVSAASSSIQAEGHHQKEELLS